MNSSSPARQPGFLQGITLLLPITMAVMGVSVLTTVIPLMEEHFKSFPYHEYAVPILMTVPSLWILLFSPVAGWLADKFGRRNILIVAMLVYTVMGTMPTYLDNIYWIFLSRCGVGICESIVMTITTTMISDYYKGHDREKWLAGQTAVASMSALLIIPLGGILGSELGWRGPFFLYAYSLILVVGIVLFTWEPEKSDHVNDSAAAAADAIYHRIPWVRIISLCALTLIGAISFYSIITQNGNALSALGVKDPAKIGLYTDLCSIGVPVGSFLYSRFSTRLHIGTLVFVDFLLIGLGFWFMGHADSPAQYTAWAFVNQIGCGMVLPTMLVWTTRGLAYEIRGLGNGIWQGSFAIGQFATALILPYLTGQLGGLGGAFKVVGSVALITALAALISKQIWGHRAFKPLPPNGQVTGH